MKRGSVQNSLIIIFILIISIGFSSALQFNKPTTVNILTDKTIWNLISVADLNSDNIKDLILQQPITGKLDAWIMNADGTKSTQLLLPSAGIIWKLRSINDLNNDGISDFIWQHSITGKVVVWLMNSNGTQKSTNVILNKTTWKVIETTDLNNDSIKDIILQKQSNGKLVAEIMNADGTKNSTLVLQSPKTLWKLGAMEDLNNDGISDLIFQHKITGEVTAWLLSYNISVPSINAPVCTSFSYSDWSECDDGVQTRTVVSSSPNGCQDGDIEISQSCDNVEKLNEIKNKTETIIPNETNIPLINDTTYNETIPNINNSVQDKTNVTQTTNQNLTCEQVGISLNYSIANILCICPTCRAQPPTICARMGYIELPPSTDCTYCCGKTW